MSRYLGRMCPKSIYIFVRLEKLDKIDNNMYMSETIKAIFLKHVTLLATRPLKP